MAAPTTEETQLLLQFYERVKDILEAEYQRKDSFLLRWLRARDLDLDQAENMLRNSLAWRRENKIDSLLDVPLDTFFQTNYPYYITAATDKKGQPVVILPIGRWDLRNCVSLGKTEESKEFIKYAFEDICRAVENTNKLRDPTLYPITQFTVIMDWKNYSYMQLCSLKVVQNMLFTAATYEAHYPEVLFKCLFINCPSFLGILLKMLKQILAVKTIEKISVYGSNRKEWEEACREIIDNDQLCGILKHLS